MSHHAAGKDPTLKAEGEAAADDPGREDRERLNMLVNQASVGITQRDLSGTLVMANQRFCDIIGRPLAEVLGSAQQALTHPEDRAAHALQWQRLLETGEPYSVNKRYVRPDESVVWVNNHVSLARDARGRPSFAICVTQDITARREAEDALREASERLQIALEAAAVLGTFVWNFPARMITGDARFARTFGLAPRQAARGIPILEFGTFVHPDDRARIEEQTALVLNSGGPYRSEYRIRRGDGSWSWIEANGYCELDPQGQPVRFPGLLMDIDERKQAELRQAATLALGDRLRGLEDTAAIAGVAVESVGRLLGVLRVAYGTLDASGQQVEIERDWVSGPEAISVVGLHRFSDYGVYLEELERGETVSISDVESDPRTHASADNLRVLGIRAMLSVPLHEHGRLVAVLALHSEKARIWREEETEFVRDVADRIRTATERARATRQLRRANETLEQRIDERTRERDRVWTLSQDLLVVSDAEGRFLRVNPAWTPLLGWTAEELLGKTSTWMEHPDDQAKTNEERQQVSRGQPILRFENRLRHKDGSYRLLSWKAVPIPDEGITYSAARDMTEQRQAEDQLRQAQKMEAVGKLTGGVAHDFNNLLQVIGGNLQLLERDLVGNERGLRRVRTAGLSVERGARLASQLLAFARRQPLTPVVLHVGRLVRGMDDLLRRSLGEDIEVKTVISGGLWNTSVDPNQLENVLLNLAINARDAMDKEGKLTLEASNVLLDDRYVRMHPDVTPGQYVLLAVSDTGTGMPPEVIERAFEPFFTTKPEGRGTGLGLSMVYGFVKQSGGHVKIYSEPGHGTTLKIYLPRAYQDEVPLSEGPEGPVEGGTETVLVVEDDPEVRDTVVETLADLGYRVLKAAEGQSALAILQSGIPVDLLFTDVVMPGPVRSPDLARQAKALQPWLEVLFTSGYTENAIVHGGKLDPGVQLLSKPHRREELSRKIRQMLDGRPPRPEDVPAPAPPPPKQRRPEPPPMPRERSRQKVLLVEDDEDIRSSALELMGLLGHDVVAVAHAEEALHLLDLQRFDVLFTDVSLPGMSGVELAREVARRQLGMRIVIASGHGSAALLGAEPRLDGVIFLPKPYALPQIQRVLERMG
ncbi:MAG: PAS domain S-box protein [Cystobacter sp.]